MAALCVEKNAARKKAAAQAELDSTRSRVHFEKSAPVN
jgi:hypothetical protein